VRVRNKAALPKRGVRRSPRPPVSRPSHSQQVPAAASSTGRRRQGVTPRLYARFRRRRHKTPVYLQNTLLQRSVMTDNVHLVAPQSGRRVAPAIAARSLIQHVKCCLSVLWHDSCFICCGEKPFAALIRARPAALSAGFAATDPAESSILKHSSTDDREAGRGQACHRQIVHATAASCTAATPPGGHDFAICFRRQGARCEVASAVRQGRHLRP